MCLRGVIMRDYIAFNVDTIGWIYHNIQGAEASMPLSFYQNNTANVVVVCILSAINIYVHSMSCMYVLIKLVT
jgi:hypothetical protein